MGGGSVGSELLKHNSVITKSVSLRRAAGTGRWYSLVHSGTSPVSCLCLHLLQNRGSAGSQREKRMLQ